MTKSAGHPEAGSDRPKPPGAPYKWYFAVLAGGWTAVLAASLAWNLVRHAQALRSLTAQTAGALLGKDLHYREWSILHGGVYVPKSFDGQSRPAPGDQEREIVTPSGQTLTLLNPAIVSRQIFKLEEQRLGISGHLTSLEPLNRTNLPDAWERQALAAFENGAPEVSSMETRQGKDYFRMMRPLVIVPSCLHCHEEQGHVPGQIRGGISVTVPMSRFATPGEDWRLAKAHVGLWLVGMTALVFGLRDLRRHVQKRQRAEAERERLIVELREALANVKTLTGLIPICSSCKKIRNDQGDWTALETYLTEHSHAEFSHGLCLDCLRKLYPQVSDAVEARLGSSKSTPEADPSAQTST